MKTKEHRQVQVVVGATCDRCGAAITTSDATTIRVEKHARQNAVHGTVTDYDCCPACWAFVAAVFPSGPTVTEY